MFKRSLVLVVVLVLLVAMPASAQGPTGARLAVATATVGVDSVTVNVGDTFTVPVWIKGVSNLYGADVRLGYDETVLQGVRVTHGGFLQYPYWVIRQGFYQPGPPPMPCRDTWCAWYALTQLRPAQPQSGSGVLAYVTFKALQPGVSPLATWAQLSAAGGVPIAVTTQSGTVTVLANDKD